MVGLEGTELPTPHPVVEPVSDIRVRNGIFRCRDGRVKTEVSVPGDRYGDEGGLEKPAFRGTNAAGIVFLTNLSKTPPNADRIGSRSVVMRLTGTGPFPSRIKSSGPF